MSNTLFNFSTAAFPLLLQGIVLHIGRHALRRAIADANHATSAVGFDHITIPSQGRETHEPVLNRSGSISVLPEDSLLRILAGHRTSQSVHG